MIDFAGFASESFGLDCAARFCREAVRLGWRNLVGFGCLGGPRYLGADLADAAGCRPRAWSSSCLAASPATFWGRCSRAREIWLYGQAQCHVGMKADSGYLFVLQDGLNTCLYAAHGGTLSLWDSGSRFAVAGQNKVLLDDGLTPAPGLKSIHFGSPNEYAFEYLMSGGENSLHVVMGLAKPDARGELALRPRPYAGKFFMSGAAAGRVLVFDPQRALDPAQYHGNVVSEITAEDWCTRSARSSREAGAVACRCGSKATSWCCACRAHGAASATTRPSCSSSPRRSPASSPARALRRLSSSRSSGSSRP